MYNESASLNWLLAYAQQISRYTAPPKMQSLVHFLCAQWQELAYSFFFFFLLLVFFAYPPTNLHFLPFKCYIADDPHEILLRIGNPAGLASLAMPVKNNMFYRVILTFI